MRARINAGSILVLIAVIIFILAFFKVGPDGLWLIGLASWAAASLVD